MSYGYFPFTVEVQDPNTEKWGYYLGSCARKVNRTGGGENFGAGAGQFHRRLTFELPYVASWRPILDNPQMYRIQYNGKTYNIVDYDDYMEQHRTLRVVGESYG